MTKPDNSIVPTINLGRKEKRKNGGTSFNNSKQSKQIELRKKILTYIEGRGTPSNFSKMSRVVEIGAWNKHVDLQPIEEEREDNCSRALSMVVSDHCSNFNNSDSNEETRS